MIRRQTGIISLVTTIMVSILLIMMALGLLVLTNGSTQQASDDELSLRAYAAAVGGVEWAYTKVAANKNFSTCDAANSAFVLPDGDPSLKNVLAADATSLNAITCVLVKTTDNKVEGTLDANASNQIVIDSRLLPTLHNIEVSWIDNRIPADQAWPPPPGYDKFAQSDLPVIEAVQPPAVELTIVNYTVTGAGPTINPTTVSIRNVVLFPHTSEVISNPKKFLAGCSLANQYACSVSVGANNDLSGTRLAENQGAIVYLRSMYSKPSKSFHYRIQLRDSAGGLITVPLSTATIDVTARSGPVYRRMVAHADIGKSVVPAGLNYVLFGDRDICKDFSVNKQGSSTTITDNGGCGIP